jgi:hypothetical protein
MATKKPRTGLTPCRVRKRAGDNLLSRWTHYHRPQVLYGRVRNGNGCYHLGKVTGKLLENHFNSVSMATWGHETDTSEKGNNAAKRSAVSTG